MTIPLFSGDAERSLLIRSRSVPQGRGTDSYGEEGRRQEAGGRRSKSDEDSTPDDLELLNFRTLRETDATVGVLNPCSLWSQQEADSAALAHPGASAFVNKINNSVGLNAVNLQPATYEVFHARS